MARKKTWYFTFGVGHHNAGKCQPILASSWDSARAKMFELYGDKWCWQYPAEKWEEMKNDTTRTYPLEEELPIIETK